MAHRTIAMVFCGNQTWQREIHYLINECFLVRISSIKASHVWLPEGNHLWANLGNSMAPRPSSMWWHTPRRWAANKRTRCVHGVLFRGSHLGMGTWGWRMGHHSPCFDFIWVNDFEPFGDLSLFSRACEPQVDWSCLMLSSDPMFRRYQPRTFPFSEDERMNVSARITEISQFPEATGLWSFNHQDTMVLAWRELRASLSFISHRCLPSRLQEHHYLDLSLA